jgi:membrane-bound lytic murein transglycosylase D
MATKARKRSRKAGAAVGAGVLVVGALVVGSHRARTGVSPKAATRELLATADDTAATGGATPTADTGDVGDVGDTGAIAAGSVGQAGWDIPNLDHSRVDYWIERFQTDKRSDFETYLNRMGRYAALISTELAKRDMPQDLVYLAMIESGFNPKAYSSAKASGLWQFIGATASRYGLDINRAVDERNDPVKATTAALDYLGDLHERFGSWYLAAAAYNMGENGLTRILRAALGRATGTDADYYAVWSRLPKETRDYVPLMVAAARIAKDPAEYGFTDIEPLAPYAFSEIVARPATPLKTLARNAGTTVKVIKDLNPQLKLDRTRNDESMVVRVPAGEAAVGAAD